jgi:Contractile injection system tube protein
VSLMPFGDLNALLGGLAGMAGGAMGGLGGGGGFGPTRYDPDNPAGYFSGFSIAVDAVREPSLGGGWQSMSLGSMEMNANDLPAGGYMRTTFRQIERITYGRVEIARPWTPGTSTHITEWFSWANKNGPTDVAITVEVPDGGSSKKYSIVFRNCLPETWNAPSFQAGLVNSIGTGVMPPTTIETLTFTFSGYNVEAFGGATPMIDASIANEEKVEPCKLVIIPNTGSVTRKMLAKMSSWTLGSSAIGGMLGIGSLGSAIARQAAMLAAEYDSVEFFLPPASMKIKKGASWEVTDSTSSEQSGPLEWNGPQPMKIEFEFLMMTQQASLRPNRSIGYGRQRDVMGELKKMLMLVENYSNSFWSTATTPPLVMLLWGSFISPLSVVSQFSSQIVKFNADGSPAKAVGSIELTQYPSTGSLTNPTSGGLAPELTETLLESDTLAHIAYRAYQSPRHWRDIAEHNGVDDPLRIPAGRTMLLPSPADLPKRNEGGTVIVDEDAEDDIPGVEED